MNETTVPRARSLPYALVQGFFKLAWTEWGDPAAPPVICVHGLTRSGRDFDALAAALADKFYVICPDLPGRGASDWLMPGSLYQPPTYIVALTHLLAAIGRPVSWVGTSLGGICGMVIASMPRTPIARLVLNDIGALIPEAAIARISGYLGNAPSFSDLAELEGHLRQIHAPFGRLSDAEWRHLARTSARELADGRLALHYDPAIAEAFKAAPPADVDLWAVWGQIRAPVMLVRGESSDVLSAEIFARMRERCAQTLVVPDAGHAPALMDAASIGAVRRFLEAGPD